MIYLMSAGMFLTLLVLAVVAWLVFSRRGDYAVEFLIITAFSLVQLTAVFPEHVGTAVIVAGMATFAGLFAIAGVMLGNWFTRSPKKED